ncbi:MAG: PPOX class F420-dependent oxidoreductase [Anaerolineales bacterium]
MKPMNNAQYRAFMSHETRTGKLATISPDGAPHVVPIWFILDGDDPMFMTNENTVKAKNIAHEPRVALSVDLEKTPYAFVLVQGRAEMLTPTPAELLDWSTRIARRYMGESLAEAYGKRNAAPGELLIRIHAEKIVARGGVAD